MKILTFLTGASGSGKSTIARGVQANPGNCELFFEFDSIGVPAVAGMIADYGSPEEWQRSATAHWVARLVGEHLLEQACVLDGQVRLSYIDEACHANSITDYQIILIDCSDDVRSNRLSGRGQPELATDQMYSWARYLRDEAIGNARATAIDTSSMTIKESVDAVVCLLRSA